MILHYLIIIKNHVFGASRSASEGEGLNSVTSVKEFEAIRKRTPSLTLQSLLHIFRRR